MDKASTLSADSQSPAARSGQITSDYDKTSGTPKRGCVLAAEAIGALRFRNGGE